MIAVLLATVACVAPPPAARTAPTAPMRCSCIPAPETVAQMRSALVVGTLAFEGRIASTRLVDDSVQVLGRAGPRWTRTTHLVGTVRVMRRWLAEPASPKDTLNALVRADTVEVWTGLGSGDCGVDFAAGETWVFTLLPLADGTLYATICDGSRGGHGAGPLRRRLDRATALPVRRRYSPAFPIGTPPPA